MIQSAQDFGGPRIILPAIRLELRTIAICINDLIVGHLFKRPFTDASSFCMSVSQAVSRALARSIVTRSPNRHEMLPLDTAAS